MKCRTVRTGQQNRRGVFLFLDVDNDKTALYSAASVDAELPYPGPRFRRNKILEGASDPAAEGSFSGSECRRPRKWHDRAVHEGDVYEKERHRGQTQAGQEADAERSSEDHRRLGSEPQRPQRLHRSRPADLPCLPRLPINVFFRSDVQKRVPARRASRFFCQWKRTERESQPTARVVCECAAYSAR